MSAASDPDAELLRLSLPDAPAIGGDSYEVAAWLEYCETMLRRRSPRSPRGLIREADTVAALRQAFAGANPEVKP